MTVTDPAQTEVKPRRPWIAAVLSFLAPGLGQLYGGEPKRGLAVYLGFLAGLALFLLGGVPKLFIGLIVFLVVVLLFEIWAVWDAVGVARRNREYVLRPFNRWYVYVALYVAQILVAPALLALSPVKALKIVSGSMEPTLLVRDHLYADLSYYSSAKPARGDLVVFSTPEEPGQRIARVIGLEGEEIEFRDKAAYIDGRRLSDPWAFHTDPTTYPRSPLSDKDGVVRDNLDRVKIPAGTCFVLGDNRDRSYDSRFFGPVPLSRLQGRLLYIYWAADKSRIGKSLR